MLPLDRQPRISSRDRLRSFACRSRSCDSPPADEPLTDQRENAIRQKQHQDDDDEAERRGMDGEKASPDELLETQQDDGTQWRTEDGAKPAKQDHHHRLDREQDVEHVRRVDVIHPGGVDRAGHADEHSREAEGCGLVAISVDTQDARGVLVLLDAAQSEAQLAAVNDNRRARAKDREREHGVEEELRLRGYGDPQERQVQATLRTPHTSEKPTAMHAYS